MARTENIPKISDGHLSQGKPSPAQKSDTNELSFTIELIQPSLCHVAVIVPSNIIDVLYHAAALSQQRSAQTTGFNRGEIPLAYIKQNFKEHLVNHLKEFLFKYCVINFLFKKIRTHKLVVAGEPRLIDITLDPGQDAHFRFELTLFPELNIYEWKYFPFKAPKRKNYKDLDRQVETFVKHEKELLVTYKNEELKPLDWCNFTITLVDQNNNPLFNSFEQGFWFRIGNEETESPLRTIFIQNKKGDVFYTNNKELQEYFSDQLDVDYIFRIEIVDILPHTYFCLEQFKKNFRIKTNKDMHKKLVEVYSYRNDISQRRAMVEESLNLLLGKHHFSIPNHLILRQQKILLDNIKHNPDYNVYRVQKDFQTRIRQLAEKQAKEALFIDRLAYNENIVISDNDVKSYINLSNRPRMKEFIYFNLPSFKIQGQEVPISNEELKRICLREKTINYVIYHLTKA